MSSKRQRWRSCEVKVSLSLSLALSLYCTSEAEKSRESEEQQQQEKKRKLKRLNQPFCYLNGKFVFALSKGNKGKWVNGIEKHRRMCYNLASLDEYAQNLCQCVHAVGDLFRECVFLGGGVFNTNLWWCSVCISLLHSYSIRGLNSIRRRTENKSCSYNPFHHK